MHVVVVVGGDLGRSPRMMYHAQSLLQVKGNKVTLIGYHETPLLPALREAAVRVVPLRAFPQIKGIPKLFLLPFKALWMFFALLWAFIIVESADVVLVQNPPAIPVLFVSALVCFFRRMRLIIDWHNFGYSIMALSYGFEHPIVRTAKFYEMSCGRLAHSHFTVTEAMREELRIKAKIKARVLYDKPPEYFQRLEEKERERFLIKLEERGLVPDLSSFFGSGPAKWARNARPFIIVTSTSYTEDENLQILIDAINDVDSKLHCKLLVFITGKGPLYNFYRDRIAMLNNTLRKCRVYQVWLPFEDYPLLLGSSDLGVSLHFSSSGLDLPMKIVDMFGCGLPVCSMKFPCIGELVHEGKNGYLFSSSQELSPLLLLLTKGYPSPNPELIRLGAGVLESSCFKKRWRQNWNEVAQSTFYQSV